MKRKILLNSLIAGAILISGCSSNKEEKRKKAKQNKLNLKKNYQLKILNTKTEKIQM